MTDGFSEADTLAPRGAVRCGVERVCLGVWNLEGPLSEATAWVLVVGGWLAVIWLLTGG